MTVSRQPPAGRCRVQPDAGSLSVPGTLFSQKYAQRSGCPRSAAKYCERSRRRDYRICCRPNGSRQEAADPNDRQAAQSPRSQRGGGILLLDVKCACLVARNLQPDRGYQVATYDFRMIETRQLSGRNNASRIKQLSGAPAAIRTRDLCLRRAALYPAELRVRRPPPRTVGVDGRNLAKAPAVRNRRFGEHAGLAPFPPKRNSTSSPPRLGPGPAGPTAWACRWRG